MRRFTRFALTLLLASPLGAQTVRYEVSLTAGAFHVSAEFPTAGKDTLLVSLPAWSPGNYEIQNYARYVHGFGAKNATGQALRWDRADNGLDLTDPTSRVRLYAGDPVDPGLVRTGPRVGVAAAHDTPWRFWIDGAPAVSVYRPGRGAAGRVGGGSVA